MLTGEKKKTKAIDNELNPVWNEVSGGLKWAYNFVGLFTDLTVAVSGVKITVYTWMIVTASSV